MHRPPRLATSMRDSWSQLHKLYNIEQPCEQCTPKRSVSLDSLINSSECAFSSGDASTTDSDSGADTRLEPDPPRVRRNSYPDRLVPKKYPQSYSSSSSGHMETIHEETVFVEPKVSVKEILARFENLTEKCDSPQVRLESLFTIEIIIIRVVNFKQGHHILDISTEITRLKSAV